ncbi:MAG: DUF2970 domain-containing protein [Bordetella sp.]|nr:MAG: DUF2970 domain-containing protein [Bordetella sp.]
MIIKQFLGTLKIVLWGFLGIRKKFDCQKDATKTSYSYIILIGIICCICLVLLLVTLANLATYNYCNRIA